jgi:chorismate mutase
MRDLQLLDDYLLRLRQERLQLAHAEALTKADIGHIRIYAHEAELCNRIRVAIKALEHDSGKFIEDFLK